MAYKNSGPQHYSAIPKKGVKINVNYVPPNPQSAQEKSAQACR
jgi:hypothetical protein